MAKIFLADPENCDVKIGNLLEKFVSKVLSYPPGTCPLTVQYSLLCASMNQTCGKCVPCLLYTSTEKWVPRDWKTCTRTMSKMTAT